MKKNAIVLLSVLTVIFLTACGEGQEPVEERKSDTENATENVSAENDAAEETQPEVASESESNEDTSEDGQADAEAESEPIDEVGGTKILVAYFSATNTTEGVAEQIADSLSADLYEIVPEQPYTDADLDYHDDNSRSTIEMNDSSARPAIFGSVEDMG